jgi:hypothetical protein
MEPAACSRVRVRLDSCSCRSAPPHPFRDDGARCRSCAASAVSRPARQTYLLGDGSGGRTEAGLPRGSLCVRGSASDHSHWEAEGCPGFRAEAADNRQRHNDKSLCVCVTTSLLWSRTSSDVRCWPSIYNLISGCTRWGLPYPYGVRARTIALLHTPAHWAGRPQI